MAGGSRQAAVVVSPVSDRSKPTVLPESGRDSKLQQDALKRRQYIEQRLRSPSNTYALSHPRVHVAVSKTDPSASPLQSLSLLLCGLISNFRRTYSRESNHPARNLLCRTLLQDGTLQGSPWMGCNEESLYVVVCCGPLFFRVDVCDVNGFPLPVSHIERALESVVALTALEIEGVAAASVPAERNEKVQFCSQLALLSAQPSARYVAVANNLRTLDPTGRNAHTLTQLDRSICTVVLLRSEDATRNSDFASFERAHDIFAMVNSPDIPQPPSTGVCRNSTWIRSGLVVYAIPPTASNTHAEDKGCTVVLSAHSLLMDAVTLEKCVHESWTSADQTMQSQANGTKLLRTVYENTQRASHSLLTADLFPNSAPPLSGATAAELDTATSRNGSAKPAADRKLKDALGSGPVSRTSQHTKGAPPIDEAAKLAAAPPPAIIAATAESIAMAHHITKQSVGVCGFLAPPPHHQSAGSDAAGGQPPQPQPLSLWLEQRYRVHIADTTTLKSPILFHSRTTGSRQTHLTLPRFLLAVLGAAYRTLTRSVNADGSLSDAGSRFPRVTYGTAPGIEGAPSAAGVLYHSMMDEYIRVLEASPEMLRSCTRYVPSVLATCEEYIEKILRADPSVEPHFLPLDGTNADVNVTYHNLIQKQRGNASQNLETLWSVDTTCYNSSTFAVSACLVSTQPLRMRQRTSSTQVAKVQSYSVVQRRGGDHPSTSPSVASLANEIDRICDVISDLAAS